MFMTVSKSPPAGADVFAVWRAGDGADAARPGGVAQIGGQVADICFSLSKDAIQGDVPGCHQVDGVAHPWAFRVDEVAFPVGASAHRHTHTGSGWRHLVSGALRIETDHGTQIMQPGMSWFETANSPVRAVALQDTGLIASIAQYSSLSDVSPDIPTAPSVIPSAFSTRTPPGTGMNCPPEAAAIAF